MCSECVRMLAVVVVIDLLSLRTLMLCEVMRAAGVVLVLVTRSPVSGRLFGGCELCVCVVFCARFILSAVRWHTHCALRE